MKLACAQCSLRPVTLFRRADPVELEFVSDALTLQLHFSARDHVIWPGDKTKFFYTVYDGWAFRYLRLETGERQIVDFLLPGDLIGLQASLNGSVQHGVCAITSLTLCQFATDHFKASLDQQAALTRGLIQTLLLDEQRFERRMLLLGQQRSTQRVCYLMLELRDRLRARGLADPGACEFPLTYEQMMDALGLSRAQLARSLAEIRERGWAMLANGKLSFLQADEMARFSGYDPPPPAPLRTLI